MIWESSYWKIDLLEMAKHFAEVVKRRRPSERTLVSLEKEVFVAAYIIRKLMDTKAKVSASMEHMPIPVVRYPSLGKPVTMMNWHRVDNLYDFSAGRNQSLTLREICNQVIHSYVFMATGNSMTGAIKKIWVCSDRHRNQHLYEIALCDLVKAMEVVGQDYPDDIRYIYDSKTRDFRITARTSQTED